METYLLWLMIGFVLIIVEMMTGTFYLLVLGIAALAAAAAAWLGQSFWVQAVISAAVAVGGVILVNRYRNSRADSSARQSLDVGQSVTLESWISEADGLARVNYRNAQWEARVTGERRPDGKVFYIHAVDGNTLQVSAVRPQ